MRSCDGDLMRKLCLTAINLQLYPQTGGPRSAEVQFCSMFSQEPKNLLASLSTPTIVLGARSDSTRFGVTHVL